MLHPKLQPLFQLVQYSPAFDGVEILDYTAFAFSQKKPWTSNNLHHGETLNYTCGLEGPGHPLIAPTTVYVMCDNTGDEEYCEGMKDFINYIQPTNLRV